jgi:hypothetical protein
MPTDLDAASAPERAEQSHPQTEITMLLFWVIVLLKVFGQYS